MELKYSYQIGRYLFWFSKKHRKETFAKEVETFIAHNPHGIQNFTGFWSYNPMEFVLQTYFSVQTMDDYLIQDEKTGVEYKCPDGILLIGGQLVRKPSDKQS